AAAQAAVDGIVADFPTEAADFQDRIDALTDIVIPAVTDSNNNGVDDATEIAAVEDLVAAAEQAYQDAADALTAAQADNSISQAEVDALTQDLADAQAAKAAAQAAVDGIVADFPTEAADFQDRIDALTDIVIPAVTDSNNNGVDDATEIAAVEDLVAAAEAAYAAADQALADAIADNAVTQAEVDELTQDLADAIAAKDAAQAAVDGIATDFPTEAGGFQDRIDALTDIVIPAVTHNITADDDQNSTNYELSTTESRADIEGSIFTLANAGVLGGIISLDLSTSTNPKITVANNETLNFTLTASGSTGLTAGALGALVDALLAGGSVNGTMDLVILKDNGAGKYEVYNVLENVYTLNNALLTFTASGSAAVTLNEAGNYSFVLAPNGSETNNLLTQLLSLNVLGSLNLDANGTVIATINNTDPVTGNVFDNDVINPVGLDVKVTTVTHGADNQGVVAGTPTVIEGQYGTLTINSDGTYSYQMTADGTALGKVDTFSYTIADGDGHSSVANIYIRLDSTLVNLDWTGKTGAQEATKATNVLVSDVDGTAATLANQYNVAVNGNGDAAGSVLTTGQTTLGVQSIPDDSGTFTVAAGQTAYIAFTTVVPANVTQDFGTFVTNNQTTNYTTTVTLSQNGVLIGGTLATWTSNAAQNGTVHYYKVTNTGTSDATYSLKVSGSDGVPLYDFNNTLTAQFGVNNIQLDVKAPTYTAAAVTGNVITGTDSAGEDTLYSSSFKLGAVAGTTEPAGYNVGTGTAIVGSYGTLTINADGSYSYLANGKVSDLGKVDVFTYKVETLDGSSASSTLSITLGKESVLIGNPTGGTAGDDVAVSQGGAETFTLGTGQDTLIFNVLNSTDALGGNGHDTWSDFSTSQGDVIDISSLLSGATAANIASYVSVTTSNGVSTISIDRDGAGTTYNSKVDLLTINEASTLEELIKGNHLIY
ncbi:type I secretion C-terminal target domain-containing protein, partial [Acinetobacter sp. YH1901134]|uniref:beta strand repeat-containing protein n=1 Tax=Acinetobacter sp. YH1901134 TaxID=2601199 RepID=UPI00211E8CAE